MNKKDYTGYSFIFPGFNAIYKIISRTDTDYLMTATETNFSFTENVLITNHRLQNGLYRLTFNPRLELKKRLISDEK